MHMADALVSPAVGGAMWAASAGLIGYSSKKVREDTDDYKIPLMGVLGAFVFAAQMINFSLPGTGSSGHLGGGMILAILLGPPAAFLAMSSILTVQALFFGDGGLLALGCNIINMGFFPCFVAYPLIYRVIVQKHASPARITAGALVASVIALQAGAFFVVLDTAFSGISDLPFSRFLLLMQPIHLLIGLVEGVVTAGVVLFVSKARPEILGVADGSDGKIGFSRRGILIGILAVTVFTGGALSWFASTHPDGLEWSMFKVSGKEELDVPDGLHRSLAAVQEKTAVMPDYGFKGEPEAAKGDRASSVIDPGTSAAGLLGSTLVLAIVLLAGFLLKMRKRESEQIP